MTTTRTTTPTPTASRPRPTAWLVVGLILTAVSVLAASVIIYTWSARLSPETETEHQSHTRPVTRIVFDAAGGDLVLMPGPPGQVSFDRRLEWSDSRPTIRETWDGETFHLTARCPDNPVRLGVSPVCSAAYTMDVPAGVTVEVHNASGRTEVRDLQGEVRVSETDGSITVAGLAGPLVLRTTSGDIAGSGLRSAEVDVQVGSGDVDLSFAAAPDELTVATVRGDLTLDVPRDGRYQVRVETSTGSQDIDVVHDPDATRMINVRTTSGDVRIQHPS